MIQFILIFSFSNLVFANTPIGTVSGVQGTVMVDGKPSNSGAQLFESSVVETKRGRCSLLIGSESVIQMGTDSKISVAEYAKKSKTEEKVALNLEYGRMRALVATKPDKKKQFDIKTRTAVMGIRGTHVVIESPKEISLPPTFLTVEGNAELRVVAQNKPDAAPVAPPVGGAPDGKTTGDQTQAKNNSGPKTDEPKTEGPKSEGPRGPATSAENQNAPPSAPAGPVIKLGANQMVNISAPAGGDSAPPPAAGIVNLPPGAAMTIAYSVAPPPPPVRNQTDFAPPPPPMAGGDSPGGPGGPGPGGPGGRAPQGNGPSGPPPPMDLPPEFNPGFGPGFGGLPPVPPPMPPPTQFDPTLDGKEPVPVTIQFQ